MSWTSRWTFFECENCDCSDLSLLCQFVCEITGFRGCSGHGVDVNPSITYIGKCAHMLHTILGQWAAACFKGGVGQLHAVPCVLACAASGNSGLVTFSFAGSKLPRYNLLHQF
ncbi:hypothetical protein KC19_2G144300 [Ceratodon purpureus]|uniref:Uncharacterized protein n=1 Tax=Ceratodon purpureus TaxID=3225 RepID=A0A8T0ITW5_CERPU|nr:hypothetical protein KC19_2G144300 [Ceratodon purpureus]